MKKCPYCAEEIQDEARKCKHCGEFLDSATLDRSLKPGDTVQQYHLLRELGRGGMAIVFLAEDTGLRKQVAIKALPSNLTHEQGLTQRFLQEARLAAGLTHPGIVTIHTVGATPQGQPFFVMEFLAGERLANRLLQGPLPIPEALRIGREMLQALGYAHARQVIHRDIKADNVLFREDGSVVIADFGIAKIAHSSHALTATGVVMGTPHYMSPEQCRGAEIDHRSDLYSTGVVLYQMLTGQHPFTGEGIHALMYAHLRQPAPRPSDSNPEIPAWLDTAVLKALAKTPDERFRSAEEFAQALNLHQTPAAMPAAENATQRLAPISDEDGPPTPPTPPSRRVTPILEREPPTPPPVTPSLPAEPAPAMPHPAGNSSQVPIPGFVPDNVPLTPVPELVEEQDTFEVEPVASDPEEPLAPVIGSIILTILTVGYGFLYLLGTGDSLL